MRHNLVLRSILALVFISQSALAIQLDWSGQFWFENHWLNNYQLDRSRPAYDNDPDFINRGGQYVGGAGVRNVVWYSSFLRLKPKVVINDSVNIKSEWHFGSPIYGFHGRGYPNNTDESINFTGSAKRGMEITAQRVWANVITDFGTLELGRAPIHWGLGAIWNSGDELFSHYQSTGDVIRLTSKFGNFWLMPFFNKVAVGNNLGGASDASGTVVGGDDDVTDLNVVGKYDNTEEDFEFGLMWTHRAGNTVQRTVGYNTLNANGTSRGSNRISYNIYDFYAKKKLGRYTLAGELPVFSGSLGAIDGAREFDYRSLAIMIEGTYTSDIWDIGLKMGHVPGQPNGDPDATQQFNSAAVNAGTTNYRAVYLHKNYNLGLIMFKYNIYGLMNNNPDSTAAASLNSPYDNPITNANYVALSPKLKLDKWTLNWGIIFGWAAVTAQKNKTFFNHHTRKFYHTTQDQAGFLGKEFDFGVNFKWDENFVLAWDTGVWFPGGYYEFSNHPQHQKFDPSMMFVSQLRAGVNF